MPAQPPPSEATTTPEPAARIGVPYAASRSTPVGITEIGLPTPYSRKTSAMPCVGVTTSVHNNVNQLTGQTPGPETVAGILRAVQRLAA